MSNTHQILVVDDEAEMRDALSEYLLLRGFGVSIAADGIEMNKYMTSNPPDLVLLDLGLPGEDGITLTKKLRQKSSVGIIIVTAYGDSEDRVLGLEFGADDYVVKPFNFRELLARIHSVLRRKEENKKKATNESSSNMFLIGNCYLDRNSKKLAHVDGTNIELSSSEFDLLDVLIDNSDRPMTRDELMEKTTHRSWEPFDRSIDVRIARLRRKIEADPTHPKIIRTVRGVGYMLQTAANH